MRKPLYVTGLFCLLWCSAALFAQSSLPAEDQSRLADGLYSRGLYDLALEEYERILNAVPKVGNEAEVAFRAAESARQLKKTEKAAIYYRRVLKLDPTSEMAMRSHYRLAEQAFASGNQAEAGMQLRQLLMTRPGPPLEAPARFLLGQVLEADGKPELALEQYRQLIRSSPDDDLAGYASLRLAALGSGESEERRKAYKVGLERAQNDAMRVEALWGLAALETSEKNHEAAADLYWQLWTRHPDQLRVREGMIYLAWSQLQAGKFERALELFEETSESRRQQHGDTWAYLRAVSLQRLDRNDEALAAFEALLNSYPESRFRSIAGYETAALYAEAGEHEKVLQYAEEIGRVSGRELEGLWMLAESARASGEDAKAIRSYSRLIREYPDAPMISDARYLRAMLQRRDQPTVAAQELESFARSHPEDPRAVEALAFAGELWLGEGNPGKTYSLWKQSLDLTAEPDPERLRRTAMLSVKLEKDKEAMQLLDRFLASDLPGKEKGEARYWKGILLERQGNAEQASEAYAMALGETPEAEWSNRARLRLGRIYQQSGKEVEALDAFYPLLEDQGKTQVPGNLLLWLLEVAREEERLEAQLRIATSMQSTHHSKTLQEIGAYAEGNALRDALKVPAAVKAWQRGLAFDSESVEAAEAALELGDALVQLNRPEEALSAFGKAAAIGSALERGRFQAEALAGMGRAEQTRENWEIAGRHFLSVSVLFDDPELVPTCLDAAADSFERAGQPDRAAAARRERQQRYPDAADAASTPDEEETP